LDANRCRPVQEPSDKISGLSNPPRIGGSNSVDFSMVEYSWEKKYFRNVIIGVSCGERNRRRENVPWLVFPCCCGGKTNMLKKEKFGVVQPEKKNINNSKDPP
jgi:hypothetical protein